MVKVSVIVPCFNEEKTIYKLLDAICHQTYPIPEIEVMIADGLSTDRTKSEIQDFKLSHPDLTITILDNPSRSIPCGLNIAIAASQGEYILRLDAHAIPNNDYIERCLQDLEQDLGDNVGGVWNIQPGEDTWIARSIAIAAALPIAVGDALYRIGGSAQAVETVPFGAFHRSLINRIGAFDESLHSNEDYEFNTRVRLSGGKVWLDPAIQTSYFARSTLRELSRQYDRYGYWKAQMLRRYPKTLRWRQLLPPMFILTLLGLGIMSIGWELARWMLAILVILYMIALSFTGLWITIKQKKLYMLIGVPLAIATIHLSWGAALLRGLVIKSGKAAKAR